MQTHEYLEKIFKAEPIDRSKLPVTWFCAPDGSLRVLSRYGDDVYDFRPYLQNPAQQSYQLDIMAVPEVWRASFRETIVAYWHFGRSKHGAPKASTVVNAGIALIPFLRWLTTIGVHRFSDLQPIHAATYALHVKTTPIKVKGKRQGEQRSERGLENLLGVVSLAWDLREHLRDAPTKSPWGDRGGQTLHSQSRGSRIYAKTPCLEEHEVKALFDVCEGVLKQAEHYLGLWEILHNRRNTHLKGGCRTAIYSYHESRWLQRSHGMTPRALTGKVHEVRGAIAFLLGLLVGQRVSELLSLETGCYFEREENGQIHSYVKGKTYKTRNEGCEQTEWLAPPYVGRLISFLERIRAPLVPRMQAGIVELEKEWEQTSDTSRKAKLSHHIDQVKRGSRALFFSYLGRRRATVIMRRAEFGRLLGLVRKASGINCVLAPHVLRRTFAVMVVHNCNGDLRYLRKHFQHWSLETTALYAANETRDQGVTDAIAEEMLRSKAELILQWLDPGYPLAGPAGEHFVRTRAKPEFRASTLADREKLACSLADGFDVRDTGHSYCIYQGVPSCGGRGLYDARACAECDGAVITRREVPIWREMAKQALKIESKADCGPSAQQVAKRSLDAIGEILRPFGIHIDDLRSASNE